MTDQQTIVGACFVLAVDRVNTRSVLSQVISRTFDHLDHAKVRLAHEDSLKTDEFVPPSNAFRDF